MTVSGSSGDSSFDKLAQASLNGIYVKAQELDRDHNANPAPAVQPAGTHGSWPDAQADAQAHMPDAETHASDAETHASDAGWDVERGEDASCHATSHASPSSYGT